MRAKFLSFAALLICAAMLFVCGCVDTKPQYKPSVTPHPTEEQTETTSAPQDGAEPAETQQAATPEPTLEPDADVDALGNRIIGAEHFIRYIGFKDLNVYEEEGDTFLDGIITNSYPQPLVCAVNMIYRDEFGGELARAQLKTRDGNYMLVLAPGDNIVFAEILTDISLVGMEYTLEFESSTGVHPE